MNWGGFTGTDAAFHAWLKELKAWSVACCRRRRRPELAEDFESLALELLVERDMVGQALEVNLERAVARKLELGDNFSTARDSDLAAGLEDFEGSFLESFIVDQSTEGQEDILQRALDGEEEDLGEDPEVTRARADDASRGLCIREDAIFHLRTYLGYKQREVASYLNMTQANVSVLERRAKQRMGDLEGVRELKEKVLADESYTQLEVAWISF